MKLNSLNDLYLDLLKDIYYAEKKLTKVLPKMAKAATDPKLKAGILKHVEDTKNQVGRLEQVFASLGTPAKAKKCAAMDGLAEEGQELMDATAPPEVMDAGLIAASQKVEHYEIGTYGTLIEYAKNLGFNDQVKLLEATLAEEKNCDKQLTTLAETSINALAKSATASDLSSKPSSLSSKSSSKKAA